jgi:glucose-1-phosphate cytidylyltransferase|tara:strand:- start:429 stop:1133 length:705 start_codon:yes stop_codon:yes gene_type:complete
MKTVILAGGYGSRIPEYTNKIPKPMIKVGGVPLLTHIMRFFKSYGFDEFLIAAGYKKKIIQDFYKNSSEFKKIKIIDTGKYTMTGGRILMLKKFFKKNELFFMTYGDGLSNVNLTKLKKFHIKHKKIASVTAVHPPVRFGELKIKNDKVTKFDEKPESKSSWINGGFFILDYKIFNYIKNDKTIFEKFPLEKLAQNKKLMAFKHEGFWKCMDNMGDKNFLDKICKENKKVPWIK